MSFDEHDEKEETSLEDMLAHAAMLFKTHPKRVSYILFTNVTVERDWFQKLTAKMDVIKAFRTWADELVEKEDESVWDAICIVLEMADGI